MNYSSDAFNEAFSYVSDGFLFKILGAAYDPKRFKQYAYVVIKAKEWRQEEAANEVIWQTASKMAAQGGGLGIFGGFAALIGGTTDITSLIYHTVEMCGVIAEIYGFDTSDDTVKALVLAGASGESEFTGKALELIKLGMKTGAREAALKALVKTLLVPVLKALGVKVSCRGGIKLAELIPVAGAIVGGGTNCWMINSTGHEFLNNLKSNANDFKQHHAA